MVGADVAVHLIRGEGDGEIVGDEGGFFIREREQRISLINISMVAYSRLPRDFYSIVP